MPKTAPTYELRVYADPVALPFGSTTVSRHQSPEAAVNAWRYAERIQRAPLARAIVEVFPNGREFRLYTTHDVR